MPWAGPHLATPSFSGGRSSEKCPRLRPHRVHRRPQHPPGASSSLLPGSPVITPFKPISGGSWKITGSGYLTGPGREKPTPRMGRAPQLGIKDKAYCRLSYSCGINLQVHLHGTLEADSELEIPVLLLLFFFPDSIY